MKKIIFLFILFIATKSFAQTNGITYQAVILNPNGEQLPGINNSNSPLVNKDVCMMFQFMDEFSKLEYQEVIQIKTDAYGMVNLVIGTGSQTAGYAASFDAIVWNALKKSLIVSISMNNCSSFTEISNQPFSYIPFAYSAINATNVTGVVAIENGGTNATNVLGARANLQINNVDNTTDLNKPISAATQTALNLKEDAANKSINVATDGTSDTKYPSVKSVKNYVDASVILSSTDLTNEVTRATAAENTIATDLTAETSTRSSADATLTTNLATEVSNRIAADLLKEDVANKSTNVTTDGTLDTKYPSVKSVKTYVDASTVSASTALTNEVTRATAAENTIAADLTAETSARTSADATLQTNINAVQADVDANEVATNTALNLKASLASPTFTGIVSGITKSMIVLGDVDNTSDANKPVSTATQTALDLKVDKVTGKGLSTEDYTTVEKTKLAAMTGTNTGDQDISGIAINSSKIGDLTDLTTTVKSSLVAAVNEIEAEKANLASPSLTGTPLAPTATAGTNTTQIATTEFVATEITGKFVDLTNSQTINGSKSFSSNLSVNGATLGTYTSTGMMPGTPQSNTLFGYNVTIGTDSNKSTAIGYNASTLGSQSVALGSEANANQSNGVSIGTGSSSSAQGLAIGAYSQSGAFDAIAVGIVAKANGQYSIALGPEASSDGANSIAIGYQTNATDNSVAIGNKTIASTPNTIQLGNTSITDVKTSGAITANSYVKSGGTSSQYLMADGSVSTGPAAVREVTDEFTATAAQTSFTLIQTPSANSKVKMYINGIRISNTAYSASGTTLTYNPTNNGGYALSAGDRIQMDFYY